MPKEKEEKTIGARKPTEFKLPEVKETPERTTQYLKLDNGFLDFDYGKRLKFGEGANTIKTDNRYGFWAGHQVYEQAPFRLSSTGTIRRITLENQDSLSATCVVGELAVSVGTLYICSAVDTWTVV